MINLARVATLSLSQSGTGVWGQSPQPTGVQVYPPRKLLEFYTQYMYVIWCTLMQSGGSYMKATVPGTFVTLVCQLHCPRDCTVVLSLLSNDHALTQLHIQER